MSKMTSEQSALVSGRSDAAVVTFEDLHRHFRDKLGLDIHDIANSGGHFDQWCDARGYGQRDPSRKERGSSQIWFAEYKSHPQGEAKQPPYCNFWHWLLRHYELMPYGKAQWIEESSHRWARRPLPSPLELSELDWARPVVALIEREFGPGVELHLQVDC